MLLSNPVGVIVLSLIFGGAVSINFIGAESYLLSVTSPVYAAYASIAGGVALWLVIRYLNPGRRKYANFALLLVALYCVLLVPLATGLYPQTIRAIFWLFLAFLGHRFFRWIVSSLVIRHLDPARAQTHLSYLIATYEMGMIIPLIGIKGLGVDMTPSQTIVVTAALLVAGLAFIALQFSPAENFEIHFSRKDVDPPVVADPPFQRLVLLFSLFVLCFGGFKFCEEYLIRTVLKEHLTSYESIRNMVVTYKMAGNAVVIVVGLGLARFISRSRISPIAILGFDLFVLLGLGAACVATHSFKLFVAFEVARWAGENCLYFLATQMIIAAYMGAFRSRLAIAWNFYFYPAAGVPLVILFSFLQNMKIDGLENFLLALILFFLAAGGLLVWLLRQSIVATLFEFIHTGHKAASVLAINLMSFLRPPSFAEEMTKLLAASPKKILRKHIILALGYSVEHKSVGTIINEFQSDQEEIQIAVVDALQVSRSYRAGQFLTLVTRAEVRSKTIRVRINAVAGLAAMYGRHSIPFLLNGLEDHDPRIVATTLETLSDFKDRSLIPYFEQFIGSETPRVRANALMGLAPFRRTRERYRTVVAEALAGTDLHMLASVLYAVGKIKDKYFRDAALALIGTEAARDPLVSRCLAWALIRLGRKEGFDEFAGPILEDETAFQAFMHFFSQLSRETRMDLIKTALLAQRLNPVAVKRFEDALHQRTFDFHEELDYFLLLKQQFATG